MKTVIPNTGNSTHFIQIINTSLIPASPLSPVVQVGQPLSSFSHPSIYPKDSYPRTR